MQADKHLHLCCHIVCLDHCTVDPGGDSKNCSNTGTSSDADNATGNFLSDTFAAFLQPCALQLQSLDLRQLAEATRRACRKD